MWGFIDFMNGPLGRAARVVLGLALIVGGVQYVGGSIGWALAAFGLVPIVMGGAARCLVEFIPGVGQRTK
jgi:hypothetical protein